MAMTPRQLRELNDELIERVGQLRNEVVRLTDINRRQYAELRKLRAWWRALQKIAEPTASADASSNPS